jgi:transketolase
MIDPLMNLAPNLLRPDIKQEPIRAGFGRGLLEAGHRNKNVVGLCADLTESTRMIDFAKSYPERFFEVGVAEQNLVTAAAGMALAGKVPFVSSYAVFSPGRNWEQIRTTICINRVGVKLAGSHAGISVGPDGATHQALEDIALMRVLPYMMVVTPCDALEAERATIAMAATPGPAYIRLAREKTPVITTPDTPFSLGKAQVYRAGKDITIVATGTMVYHALMAAERLSNAYKIEVEVINVAVIKPLDATTIVASARKTGAVLTAEEHQVAGGLGGAVAELLGEQHPVPIIRVGIMDHFGESGRPEELMEHFGLTAPHIVRHALKLLKRK